MSTTEQDASSVEPITDSVAELPPQLPPEVLAQAQAILDREARRILKERIEASAETYVGMQGPLRARPPPLRPR